VWSQRRGLAICGDCCIFANGGGSESEGNGDGDFCSLHTRHGQSIGISHNMYSRTAWRMLEAFFTGVMRKMIVAAALICLILPSGGFER
jgi:hypothetical protein